MESSIPVCKTEKSAETPACKVSLETTACSEPTRDEKREKSDVQQIAPRTSDFILEVIYICLFKSRDTFEH